MFANVTSAIRERRRKVIACWYTRRTSDSEEVRDVIRVRFAVESFERDRQAD